MLKGVATVVGVYFSLLFISVWTLDHIELLGTVLISGVLFLTIIGLFSIFLKKISALVMGVNLYICIIIMMVILADKTLGDFTRKSLLVLVYFSVLYSINVEAIKGYCIILMSLFQHPYVEIGCKKYLNGLDTPHYIFKECPQVFLIAALLVLLKLHQ